jgi:hypothetical protein
MASLKALKPIVIAAALSLAALPAAAQHGQGGQRGGGRAVQRGEARPAPRAEAPRAAEASPRVAPRAQFAPRYVRPSVVVRPYYRPNYRPYYYRPYYTFRPRWNVGFGLWVGYPIAYPYAYSYPYPPPEAYPYPNAGPVTVTPGTAAAAGGLSFEIEPNNAEVYIDGQYVGQTGEFSPTMQPLSLTPGRHHVEVRAQGYQTMPFDVDVVAGQVIPYQGTMQPE